jgi:hypothetical protein
MLLKFIGDGGSSFRAEERHNRMSLNFKFWMPPFLKHAATSVATPERHLT